MSTHVDEFIDDCHMEHTYARWVLNHMRLPASLKIDFDEFMKDHKLYCDYNGKKARITFASRLGYVGVRFKSSWNDDHGYDDYVDIGNCSNFRSKP